MPQRPTIPPRFGDRNLAVHAQLGVGTPLGFAGAAAEWTPVRSITVGVGLGGNASGLQESLMARLRPPFGAFAIAVGGGVSTGPYSGRDPIFDPFEAAYTQWTWTRAWWLNAEISAEYRWGSGWELRGFLGDAFLANRSPDACGLYDSEAGHRLTPCGEPLAHTPARGVTLAPYIGVALGHAFGP